MVKNGRQELFSPVERKLEIRSAISISYPLALYTFIRTTNAVASKPLPKDVIVLTVGFDSEYVLLFIWMAGYENNMITLF